MDDTGYNRYKVDANSLFDLDGNKVEIERSHGGIQLYSWTINDDSRGRPVEHHNRPLSLSPRQAIEIARRLFITATE